MQAVAAALTEMMGYPVTLLQPGGRPAGGGDPMAISVPLTAGAGIRASCSALRAPSNYLPNSLRPDLCFHERLTRMSRCAAYLYAAV